MSSLQHRVLSRSADTAAHRDAAPVLVTVQPGKPGLWLVRSSDDRMGGTFVDRKAAVIFARDETTGIRGAVVIVGGRRSEPKQYKA